MPAETIDEQLIKYLTDVHSTEVNALAQLKTGAESAEEPQLAAAFREHLAETEEQKRLIGERLEAHERAGAARAAVLDPLGGLRAPEPWAGYDDQSVAEIKQVLTGHEADLLAEVRDYERGHKGRASVVQAAERELAMSSF